MQLADPNSSNWKPVDLLDRLTNGKPELHAHRVRRVSSSCHSEVERSHSEEEQHKRRICALPNQTTMRGVVVVADGRWREVTTADGMKKQSNRDLVRAEGLDKRLPEHRR